MAFAAPPEKSAGNSAQELLKNIARQHCSTTLSLYDAAAQRYVDTEAAAAWLDDDIATGWPALKGKQHYLVRLAEPQMLTNFELSTKIPSGTITIYTGDADAAPGDKSWTQVAKDVPVESINNHKLAHRINKFAKYVLIETNIADSSPIYSINIFGERQASAMSIVKRAEPANTKQLLGDFVNNQTAFNMAGIYAKGAVTFANSGGSDATWQRAIDDDPETLLNVKPSTAESGLVLRFDGAQPFTRLSLLTNAKTRGKVDIFLLSEAPQNATPVSIEGVAPSVTLSFDGSSQRAFADFAETKATALAIRWAPESGDAALSIRELNIFADLALAEHEVTGASAVIAQGLATRKALPRRPPPQAGARRTARASRTARLRSPWGRDAAVTSRTPACRLSRPAPAASRPAASASRQSSASRVGPQVLRRRRSRRARNNSARPPILDISERAGFTSRAFCFSTALSAAF